MEFGGTEAALRHCFRGPCSCALDRCPPEKDWALELKSDGFRAIVTTGNGLRVRSRRGWDMTSHVP